jgi:alkylation response protein AidB-like acyl-CoA dehydrogenase
MDLHAGPEHDAFRGELKDFLRANWRPDGNVAEFRGEAIAAGYLYRSIPRRFGGSEQPADILKARVIVEEFERARAPMEVKGPGVQMLVPTLLERGAEWQKERFIRPTIEGKFRWAQGYSEPGSGSDLASLRTRAELRDGQWVINGQKVWTSYARNCQYMFALVRTEPEASKHAGISYLLIDLKQPGIVIRPMKQITGGDDFNEVFFTDAVTPADWIVGARGEGWDVSKSLLKHERNMLGGVDRTEALYKSMVGLARRATRHGRPAIEDAWVRDRLAALKCELETQRLSSNIQITRELAGDPATRLQLMNKLAQSNFAAAVSELSNALLGDDALISPIGNDRPGNERWVTQYMNSLAAAIAGGTSNIQRNIIAERGLGLPRDGGIE